MAQHQLPGLLVAPHPSATVLTYESHGQRPLSASGLTRGPLSLMNKKRSSDDKSHCQTVSRGHLPRVRCQQEVTTEGQEWGVIYCYSPCNEPGDFAA